MKNFKIFIAAILGFLAACVLHVSGDKCESRKYEKPVTAIVNGEEVPVIFAKIHGNYIEIQTDSGEKIFTANTSVIIYETEIYYEEE